MLLLGASRKCRTHRVQAESKRWINNKVGFAKLTGKGGTRCFTRPERRVKERERELNGNGSVQTVQGLRLVFDEIPTCSMTANAKTKTKNWCKC